MKRVNPTARQYEFGMNATTNGEAPAQQDVATILEQCANAMLDGQRQQQERQKNFETQMAANMAAFQAQMANATMQQQQMQQQQQMTQQAINAANQQAAAKQVQFTQPPQQQQPPTQNWQPQAWQAMQQQGATICPPAFQQQTNRGTKAPTPFRWYENNNYCWTHGHHVEDDHTSATCNMPDPGHQHAATKMNTMGGVDFGSHKTIMPS